MVHVVIDAGRGADLSMTDARFTVCYRGLGTLTADVPRGVFNLRVRLGDSTDERTLVLM
jgi:hypothetical protein